MVILIGSLGASVEELDGAFASKMTKACTHLVVSEKDWEGGAAKGERGRLTRVWFIALMEIASNSFLIHSFNEDFWGLVVCVSRWQSVYSYCPFYHILVSALFNSHMIPKSASIIHFTTLELCCLDLCVISSRRVPISFYNTADTTA